MSIVDIILAWIVCLGLIAYWLLAQFARGMSTTGNADLGRGPTISLLLGVAGMALLIWSMAS